MSTIPHGNDKPGFTQKYKARSINPLCSTDLAQENVAKPSAPHPSKSTRKSAKQSDNEHNVVLVPYICKAKRVVGVNEKIKEICDKIPMAHEVDVPAHYKDIDLLIGIDYFWQINMSGKVEVSEGLFLIETQLGLFHLRS